MAQPQQTLAEITLGAGIRLKHYAPGHTEHLRCPKCDGGNSKELSLSVTIDADGAGATWVCHRGSCGWKDGQRLPNWVENRYVPPARTTIKKPTPDPKTDERPDWLQDFFAERNIGDRTVRAFGVYATIRRFPGIGTRPCIVFPYEFRGELVNRKFRPHPEKQPQQQDPDAMPTLFNVDRLGEAPAEIVWVEGEPDVMALFECQIENAVTLKDGAPKEATFKQDDRRFEALRTHADMLGKVKRFVLAGDMDAPGLALREELARRLGRHRCWLVTWPEDCKDASDVLRIHGPDVVQQCVNNAVAYPISGIQQIKVGSLLALRHNPPPAVMTTGTLASDRILKLPYEGRLIIVSGYPNHGKTAWARFVMVHTAADHERRWGVFSPEMQPWEEFVAQCAEVLMNKPFWPVAGFPGMTDAEVLRAERWLADRITMLVCDAEGEEPSLDWLLERAGAIVLRDGVTDFVIDPWNEIAHNRGPMSETDYIGRSLQRLRAFAQRHGCNVWVIAHPKVPLQVKPGEKRPVPGPYEISGSAHWANKPDIGITIHSAESGTSELHLWKARHRRWGVRGSIAKMDYDQLTGRYSTPIRQEEPAEENVSPPNEGSQQ